MANSWYTSDTLIDSIKRKIAFPINQNTFSTDDILAFSNEEMAVSQVPSVLSYHEEYFVYSETKVLKANTSRYAIPTRAIGMRLRSLFYKDSQGSLYEMTRISSDDKSFFQSNQNGSSQAYMFYLENNDIVLTPTITGTPTGSLVFYFFIRPNQLVSTDRVATVSNFIQSFTVSNSTLSSGSTVTLNGTVYTAVSSSPGTNQFLIDSTSILTATNLVTAINVNSATNAYTAANSGTVTVTLTLASQDVAITDLFATSNSTAFALATNVTITCSTVPTNIVAGTKIDFMQTLPGHKIYSYGYVVPTGAISGVTLSLPFASIPTGFQINDYIASENECIIPMIPDDLHSGLAERTAARILASLGDQAGLQVSGQKIQEINQAQGMLLDNRAEGNPRKVLARNSLLRAGRSRKNFS